MINLNSSLDDIISHVFMDHNPNTNYLGEVIHAIQVKTEAELQDYVMGPLKRGGNLRILSHAQTQDGDASAFTERTPSGAAYEVV